ncbi:DUF4333 domain-containing protein [Cellulomonas chitinilytica]|uniref:DUF4333 domain-containing protein n=1 Tax=Cellulomonas chitinilytica TaxID=398759 RepID=UPI0019432061|nr:DUF4333 domain-containing protein [Cellulomonas chitinilytica]
MRPVLTPVVLAVTALLAGCSVHANIDTKFVPSDEVEKKTEEVLVQEVGQAPDATDCPDDLPVRVGADVRCTITVNDQRIGVTVSVAKVGKGTDYTLSVEVDDEPLPAGS